MSPDTQPTATAQGIWENRTYGLLLDVGSDGLTLYHRAGEFCWRESVAALGRDYLARTEEYSVTEDRTAIFFRATGEDSELAFTGLSELPKECAAAEALSRTEVLDIFAALFDKHYAFFPQREILWPRRKAEVIARLAGIEDDSALLAAMSSLLTGLADPVVAVRTGERWVADLAAEGKPTRDLRQAFTRQSVIGDWDEYFRRWHAAIREQIQTALLGNAYTDAMDGAMIWGSTPGGPAYWQIRTLDSRGAPGEWRDALDKAVAFMQDKPAVVLDLSLAEAGSERIGRQLAALLLGRDQTIYKTRPHELPEGEWIEYKSSGGDGAGLAMPLYVLTSDQTSGAAERVVMALRALPTVTQVGTPTRGAMTEPITKSLPNGWLVRLGAIAFADRDEAGYEGIGLAPDFALDLYPDGQLSQAHHRAVITLLDLIAEGHFQQPPATDTAT